MVKVREDMTGWKMWEHGVEDSRIIVLSQMEDYVDANGRHKAQWLCECNCAERTKLVLLGASVKNGSTKSCGCLRNERMREARFVDMTGWKMKEHGVPDSRLTVVRRTDDYVSPTGQRKVQWLCQCECGNTELVVSQAWHLSHGDTKSCGCLHKEQASMNGSNNKKTNRFVLNIEDEYGLYGIGYCTNTGREFYFDMDDYEKIKNYSWCENRMKNGYCRLETHDREIGQSILMHWVIVGKRYDHEDRNPMNNRKYNLRVATHTENARNHNKQRNNTSGFTGVSFDKRKNKWAAYIVVDKQRKHLGYFIDQYDAVVARLKAEKEYFGEFSPQKELFKQYKIDER